MRSVTYFRGLNLLSTAEICVLLAAITTIGWLGGRMADTYGQEQRLEPPTSNEQTAECAVMFKSNCGEGVCNSPEICKVDQSGKFDCCCQ